MNEEDFKELLLMSQRIHTECINSEVLSDVLKMQGELYMIALKKYQLAGFSREEAMQLIIANKDRLTVGIS